MKHWYLIPLAAIIGLAAGSWGPRADLAELKELGEAKHTRSENHRRSGFGAITELAHIPDRAKSRRPSGKRPVPKATTNEVPPITAPEATVTDSGERADSRKRHPGFIGNGEDLRSRLDEAAELWRVRGEIARTEWKSKLGLDGARSDAFDSALDAMNADLREVMAEFAVEVAKAKEISPELGIRMMNAVTGTLTATYDAIGEGLDDETRALSAQLPVHDFIDPYIFEPMIQVQDYLR